MMKPLKTALAATLIAFVAFTAAQAETWKLYGNAAFGFTIDVPTSLFTEVEPSQEGEGVVFSNPDTGVTLTVYGIENEARLSLRQVKRLIAQGETRDITYDRIKRNWFVLSGYEQADEGERDIFYSRLAANRDRSRFSAFELVYPETMRGIVDPLIRRLSLSLKAPRRN